MRVVADLLCTRHHRVAARLGGGRWGPVNKCSGPVLPGFWATTNEACRRQANTWILVAELSGEEDKRRAHLKEKKERTFSSMWQPRV